MIPAIIIGRSGSKGFPGKNEYPVCGMPMLYWPIKAAEYSKNVDRVYFSTDCNKLKSHINYYFPEHAKVNIIDRPEYLATDEALGEDVFIHAYEKIKKEVDENNTYVDFVNSEDIEFVVLMFANAPCIKARMIDEMVEILRSEDAEGYDSICTVSKYNMYSPYRMRKVIDNRITEVKQVLPFNEEVFADNVNCDRDSGISSYIYDCSCAVVKPYCLEEIKYGTPPQRWLGKYIIAYEQKIPALDVDYEWQVGQVQYWIKNEGWL